MPLVRARVSRSLERAWAEGAGLVGELAQLDDHGVGGDDLGPGGLGCVAEGEERGDAGAGEGRELLGRAAEVLGRDADVPHQGGALVGELLEAAHRQPDLGQGPGSFWNWRARSSLRSAVASPAMRGVAEEAGDRRAVAGQRLEDGVPVAGERGELGVLVGEDLEDAVGLAQGGVGAVDDLAELVAAGREAGSEVVEDEAEAVAVGDAVDVLEQVEVHRLAVVLQRQQALALAGPPSGISSSSGGGSEPGRAAGSGCSPRSVSPISDCGRMMQEASSRKSLKPSSSIRMTTTALPGSGAGRPRGWPPRRARRHPPTRSCRPWRRRSGPPRP